MKEDKRFELRLSLEESLEWGVTAKREGKTTSQLVRDVMSAYVANAGGELRKPGATESGLPERVTPPPPQRFSAEIEKLEAELKSIPRDFCSTCLHPKKKHGGFGHSCQEDNCLCARFE